MIKTILLSRIFVVLEFFLLCVALPSYIIIFRMAPLMFFFLWAAVSYCFFIYYVLYFKNWKTFWNTAAVKWPFMKPILRRWVICCILMTLLILLYDPDRFLYLVKNKFYIIPGLLFAYPILSALPQEFIFCTFFFKRYESIFKTDKSKIFASAVVFAYAHVLFINWIAPLLSFIAGLIFARTYNETRSLALVTIEHGLYGNFLFIIGLGWYFYGGAVTP